MIKKVIKYKDYDGNEQVKEAYFHLSKLEAAEMEVEAEGGLEAYAQKIVKAEDNAEILRLFKKLILKSYGEKSKDGTYFDKSEEVVKRFEYSEAFSELLFELGNNTEEAVAFFNGISPDLSNIK